MRESRAPTADGQVLEVEDRSGVTWQVECLGDPVAVGSRVRFELLSPVSALKGQLIRVLSASRDRWVCRVGPVMTRGILPLVTYGGGDGPTLQLLEKNAKGAVEGDRVVVVPEGDSAPNRSGKRHGASRPRRERGRGGSVSVRVQQVLGKAGSADADFAALVWKHRLPEQFSRRARLEAEAIDESLTDAVLRDRLDLREVPFITIDPASAKDHDDAVFAEERVAPMLRSVEGTAKKPTWQRRLWVAIADVSHFVAPGGFLDSEARRRGNSFYFPDRSIPMLPERLSSDLCSLRPDVDRLAMVVEMRIGSDGSVVDALFHEAVIRSHARLSYEQAAEWLEGEGENKGGIPVWGDSLRCLDQVARDLTAARTRAGALTLDLPEVEIVVGEGGAPIDARLRSRNRAHFLIEEAMLEANRRVARALEIADRTTLHRVHPPPSVKKLEALTQLLDQLGIDVQGDLEAPGVLSAALLAARGLPSEERVHMAALRSMSQARYEAEPGGHYALRFDHYLHFTSPIRRYADLEVHRGLRRLIRGESPPVEWVEAHAHTCDRVARWLSGRERVATDVEREAEALAGCALMSGRGGEPFRAVVTGVTDFGLFVRLESPSVSGLVTMRSLDGHWDLNAEGTALVAERSGRRIEVGESIRVQLLEVDSDRARLSFRPERNRKNGDGLGDRSSKRN